MSGHTHSNDIWLVLTTGTEDKPSSTVQLGACLEYDEDVMVGVLIDVADFLNIEVGPSLVL